MTAADVDEEKGVPDLHPLPPQPDVPTESQREEWTRRLKKFHAAAGHPSNRGLARMLADAGKWQVEMARDFKCPRCQAQLQ